MPIWFGYAPDKKSVLLEEIRFAQQHFDYIELTPPPESFSDEDFEAVRDTLCGFPLVGHLHPGLDFALGTDAHLLAAKRAIAQLAVLGAAHITIHPTVASAPSDEKKIAAEVAYLQDFIAQQFGMSVYLENILHPLQGSFDYIASHFFPLASPQLTFNLAHARLSGEIVYLGFLQKIAHIKHIHFSALSPKDHQYFPAADVCRATLQDMMQRGYEGRITLNMFGELQEENGHHEKILQQLAWCKTAV